MYILFAVLSVLILLLTVKKKKKNSIFHTDAQPTKEKLGIILEVNHSDVAEGSSCSRAHYTSTEM